MTDDVTYVTRKVNVVSPISLKLNISETVRNGWIATKLAHDGPQYSPHSGCAQCQGKGHVIRTRLLFHENVRLIQWSRDRWRHVTPRDPDIFDPDIFEAQYMNNCVRYMVDSYWLPIGNHTLGIQWSHDQWRHVTRKVKVVIPIPLMLNISETVQNGWIGIRYQTCTRWSTEKPASRMCSRSRSKVTWYGHFCDLKHVH